MDNKAPIVHAQSFGEEQKEFAIEHVDETPAKFEGISETQRVLIDAGDQQRAKALGTFGAIRFYWKAFLWAQYACIGSALTGFDTTVSGSILSVPPFRATLGTVVDGQLVISAAWQVGFNCASQIFTCFGALASPWLGDKIGRKGCLLVACIVSTGAIFLEFFVKDQGQLMWFWGRAVNGIALGLFSTVSSSYAAEVSPLQLRAVSLGSACFYIVIGQFTSACVIQGCGNRTDNWAFRIPISVQWVFVFIVFVFLPFCPESPWILIKQGKVDKAQVSLRRLFGHTGEDLDLHLAVIQDTIEFEARLQENSRFIDLFKGTDLRRTMIVMLLYICQQVTGVQFVLGYSTYFFELAGFSVSRSFKLGVGTLAIALFGNLCGILSTNSLGRRRILLGSIFACSADTLLIGILSLIKTQSALWAMGSFTMLYMLAFQVGLGPLSFTVMAEIGAARLRTKIIAWGTICNQIFGLIINIINPYLINPDEANLGGKVGWIFGGMSLIGSAAAWMWIPETGQRTIDELDLMFAKKIPSRQFKNYVITHEDRVEMEKRTQQRHRV